MSWSSRIPFVSSAGRWSPFSGSRSRDSVSSPTGGPGGPVVVSESDYSYIDPDDDDVDAPLPASTNTTTNINTTSSSSFSTQKPRPERGTDVVHLRNKTARHALHFAAYSISDGKLQVGAVRLAAAKRLGVSDSQAHRIKLFYKGRNLKDDAARCRDEGLTSEAEPEVLAVVGDSSIAPPSSAGARAGDAAGESGSDDDGDGDGDGDDGDGGDNDAAGEAAGGARRKRNRSRKKKGKKRPGAGYSAQSSGTSTPLPAPETFNYTPPPPPPSSTTPQPQTQGPPLTALAKLQALQNTFRATFLPQCREFIAAPPGDAGKRREVHKKLSETVLAQILLKTDAVETEGEEAARAKRKELVREVQGILGDLDRVAGV